MRRWMKVGSVAVLAMLFCNASCSDVAADCKEMGGTYNASSTPKCSLPLNEALVCSELGGTYNASGSPKCALPAAKPLTCTSVSSVSASTNCKDAGNFDSTCASVACPAGFSLTGGGGICAAGDRKLKGLNPNFSTGQFFIMCEKQGVAPQVTAICCKL